MYIAQAAAILIAIKGISVIFSKTVNYLFPDEQGPIAGKVIIDDVVVWSVDDIRNVEDSVQLLGGAYEEDSIDLLET